MEQIEMDVKMEIDLAIGKLVEDAVKNTVCCLNNYGIKPNTTEEAYGITAHAHMKAEAIEKEMKKAMKALLETLDTGLDTRKEIAKISNLSRLLAVKSIQMAAETENIIRAE